MSCGTWNTKPNRAAVEVLLLMKRRERGNVGIPLPLTGSMRAVPVAADGEVAAAPAVAASTMYTISQLT